jgi:hypothetical protein
MSIDQPVDGVGYEMAGIEEEPKELGENGQRATQNVEHGASGVVGAMEEAANALQPADWVPPIGGDYHANIPAVVSRARFDARCADTGWTPQAPHWTPC